MRHLTAAELLKAEVPRETVEIPALGGCVTVRGMTGRERREFDRWFLDDDGKVDEERNSQYRERLVLVCCVDESGQPMFSEDQIAELSNVRADVLERIAEAAGRVSGFVTDAAAKKNSAETTPAGE